MTMAVGVNNVAAILFLVAWALYLVAEAARTGALSKPNCDNGDDDGVDEKLCNGYAAAAVWFIFAVVAALVAAGLSSQREVRSVLFVTSLALAALGYVCEYGGLTSAVDEGKSDRYTKEYKDLENGYGAATVFFFFAFVTAIVTAVLLGKFTDKIWMGTLSFFVFLGWWALALTGDYGGYSKYQCDLNDSGDLGKAETSRCNGYGFAAFCTVAGMFTAFWFAFLVFRAREDPNKIWIGWFIFAAVVWLGYSSAYASEAQAYCNYITEDNNDKQCSGYSAAAFFIILAAVAAVVGLIFACKEMFNSQHLMFMASFSLFFLGYACYLGGQSVYNCKQDQDTNGNDDAGYDDLCDGYGAGTFFAICSFLLTGVGSYFAYQGSDEAPHEQMQDDVQPDSMPPTTVAHSIADDDDYNKA